ncbi:DUF2057 domain-containing protein [Amphritea opalescens]|uniref:DUF2057 domain-containing protein n=1 Tax=Amphritea opalescens TaxID=2490544 RepID=A0A430KPI4_9GAMM|nr:DUF2057 domain-containing protein [Amphritea opalescens]RTE65253.1 DUF2057 domain-containing protein [Amphritea opalescens]
MRFGSNIFSLIVFLFSSSAMAEVKFSVGSDIMLIAVNGSEIVNDSFFENTDTMILPNGKNQILVQYSTEVKASGGSEIETTDAHVIVFNAEDTAVHLSAPEIKKLSQFREFNLGGAWLLSDNAGTKIQYLSQPLIKEGFQINRNYEQELRTLNESDTPVSMKKSMTLVGFSSTAEPNTPMLKQNANEVDSINLPETLLRYWYLNADLETRAKFKVWLDGK